jgi:hypothetical protein
MRLLWLALLMFACGPGIPHREEIPTPPTADFAAAFASATQAGDVKTIRAMLGPSATLGGLWFPDPMCQREFVAPGDVGGGRLDELARCLATLKLSVATRKDALEDVAILTYPPGIEIEARFIDRVEGPWLSWIGFEARRSLGDALPTIAPETLEGLRVAGTREPAVHDLDAEIARLHYSKTWVKLCINADGEVTGVHPREASSARAMRTFTAAIADWKFKPFAPDGHPMPVCSLVLVASPLAFALQHENIPYPLGESSDIGLIVPIQALHRVKGERLVFPNTDEKWAIQKAGVRRVIGIFQFCIDERGATRDVHILRSTGLPHYDQSIIGTIGVWQYEPYLDEGTVTPVCTSVTFVYTQH